MTKRPTRIIFLDIDGVLTTAADGFQHMQPEPVAQLADIIRRTGCKIVLSSSWRHATEPGPRYSGELLRHTSGQLIADATIGVTPDLSEGGFSRSAEICSWLAANMHCANWCAIDDCELDFKSSSVRTDPKRGLTREDAEQAIRELLMPEVDECGIDQKAENELGEHVTKLSSGDLYDAIHPTPEGFDLAWRELARGKIRELEERVKELEAELLEARTEVRK